MIQVLCGLALIAATLALGRAFPDFDLFRFPLCWAGVLVALDGAVRLRRGSSPLRSPADWIASAAASVAFWDVFELVDLRLRNWWYVGVSHSFLGSAVFGAISFATVLPAARLSLALAGVGPPVPLARRWPRVLVGALMLALALAFPRYAFPFAWIFLWPFCEAAAGVRVPLRAMVVGLPLGLIWESLNWRCQRGWIYTVPFFERPKLFEMPLPGYLGYLPFALECAAALALVDGLRPRLRGGRALAVLVALAALHLGADQLARRQTVISFADPR